MQIQENTVVRFDYTLKDDAGQVIDTSDGREPLTYLHGVGQIVPGLEKQMTGKATGDSMQVTVDPAEGYGEKNPQLIGAVPRERFEGVEKIEPGMQFTANTETGPRNVVVTEVSDTDVTIDANHPLAGQTLHFDISVVEVRTATDEEIDHGHVHGDGGHQH